MNKTKSTQKRKLSEEMAELTSELARTCNEKENSFAAMFNLTPAEFKCLRLFTNKSFISIKELSQLMKLTPGRITHILTSLEGKSFVIRKVDQRDKRNIIVHLTNNSTPFIKNLNENHIKIHKEILAKIDPDKRELVLSAIADVINALKSWSDEHK